MHVAEVTAAMLLCEGTCARDGEHETYTPHVFSRCLQHRPSATKLVMFACHGCAHERQWGLENLQPSDVPTLSPIEHFDYRIADERGLGPIG